MKKKIFSCTRGSLTIRGTEYRPDGDCLPIAVVSHGFLSNQRETAQYAQTLAGLGYCAYTFDFCGGAIGGKSDGKLKDMSVLTEVADLLAVIAYAESRPYTNEAHLVLMGCSQGGFVSALAAAKQKERVEKLILFYPAFCIPDDARKGKMGMFSFDPQHIPEEIVVHGLHLGRCYPEAVLRMDALEEVRGYPRPVLIVHGMQDKTVDVRYAYAAQKAYGDACQMLLLRQEGHGFSKKGNVVAKEAVRQFLIGNQEVLTIDVHITGSTIRLKPGRRSIIKLDFDGTAIGPLFQGKILPGAADVQERKGMKPVRFCADYHIAGTDFTGTPCQVHIVNENTGSGWIPTISTDSKALAFLNHAGCSAVLEDQKQGPIVHIYCKREETQ